MNRGTTRQDVRAFRALYQNHYGFVWSTVRRMGVRPDSIDDAVQDAFLVAFRRWSDLPRERHRAWLYGIARRISSNARRLERRRTRKHEALRQGSRTHAECRRPETSAVIDGFLRTLPPHDRELFVLGAIEGLTGRELSAALQAAPSTLHDRLQALRRRFREEVGPLEPSVAGARPSRPRASAASWALLLPQLSAAAASPALVVGGLVFAAASAILSVVVVTAGAPDPRMSSAFAPVGGAAQSPVPSVAALAPARAAVAALAPARPAVEAVADPVDDPATMTQHTEVQVRRRSRGPRPSSAALRPDTLSDEAALVTEIKRALDAGDASRARALAERHAAEHSTGALSDAVAALHVDALCRLGQLEQAQAQAQRHLRRRPNSPVSRRLSRGCTLQKTPAQP